MDHVDPSMLRPATPPASRNAQREQQHVQMTDAPHTCAPTPRTLATITQLVPRQDLQTFDSHSWLATQVWQYFDDSGYERSTAPGVAGHELRAQQKCRCLYCDLVVAATPTTMATHIVSACRVADGTAKRALRTGKADLLTTLAVAPAPAKPRRPEALELVVTSSDLASSARGSSAFASPSCDDPQRKRTSLAATTSAAAGPRTLDYVSAFAWEVSQLRKRSHARATGASDASERLDDAVKRAEALIHASVSAKSSSAGADSSKENQPPRGCTDRSDDTAHARASGPKRPRLSVRSLNAPAHLESRKPQQSKKRLFAPLPEPTPHRACDVASLVRDLAMACVAERVPLAFLSSPACTHAMQSHSASAFEPADVQRHATAALEELATAVDSVCDAMRACPSSALTFVVQRMAPLETRRATVYLVDASGTSALVSCQQAARERSAGDVDSATAAWLQEVQQHYVRVSEWCGQPLHVCAVGYPRTLERQLLETLASHANARLVGSCMAQALELAARDAIALLHRAPDVVQSCAELALLVNEVAQQSPPHQRSSAQPAQLVLLAPRGDSVVSYAVLLAQVQTLLERTATTLTAASALGGASSHLRSELLCRVDELLQAQWAAVPMVLALLRPLAVAELLFLLQTRASARVKLTSGACICLELWLFASVHRSLFVSAPELRTWRSQFLERLGATRTDHELACLLLDPRLAGAGLSAEGRDAARASVVAVAKRSRPDSSLRDLETQLLAFANRTGAFGRAALWNEQHTADPLAFWRSVEHAHELQAIALLVCSYAPCRPSASSRVVVLDAGADMDQATRAAQVRHHLERHDVLRDPATLSTRSALELLPFLLRDDAAVPLESQEGEALAWRLRTSASRSVPPRAAIEGASRQFAEALRATVARATASRTAAAAPGEVAPALPHLLPRFSSDWIDCSDAGRAAMRRALAAVAAP